MLDIFEIHQWLSLKKTKFLTTFWIIGKTYFIQSNTLKKEVNFGNKVDNLYLWENLRCGILWVISEASYNQVYTTKGIKGQRLQKSIFVTLVFNDFNDIMGYKRSYSGKEFL